MLSTLSKSVSDRSRPECHSATMSKASDGWNRTIPRQESRSTFPTVRPVARLC